MPLFKTKATGVVNDLPEGSEAHKRALRKPQEYEPVVEGTGKGKGKGPDNSG